jgi:hypothetical protein
MFHFFVIPVLTGNLLLALVRLKQGPGWPAGWSVVVASALLTLAFIARTNALVVQNRIIRLEETLRLSRILPEDLRPRVGELSTSQLVALRFASDEEVGGLVRQVLSGQLKGRDEIKRSIQSWRPDFDRV